MENREQIKRLQMISSLDEFKVIKVVVAVGDYGSISDYIRSLITADVTAKKRAHKSPWIFGMKQYDWDNLADYEKEEFFNRIGTVKPGSLDYHVKKAKGQVFDDEPVMGKNDIEL